MGHGHRTRRIVVRCLAYTQLDDLALLQVVSLFGLGGVSFLLASSSAITALLLDRKNQQRTRFLPVAFALAALVALAQGWGSWRLAQSLEPGPMATIATIGSDLAIRADVDIPITLPSRSELSRVEDVLFERTRLAAGYGAEVVVWNEIATAALTREDEASWSKRGEALAQKLGVDIVMGYAVWLEDMRRYENKYLWVGPEGKVDTYNKHHPVPGVEECEPGVEPIRVHNRTWGRAAGAICYDCDFPQMGMMHARAGAGGVVVPSSDWRGIDPFHTRMASVRGIEGGFSVVRSVLGAASGAYDALGQTLAFLPWQDDGRRIMLARVPVTPIPTLYSQIGDAFSWICLGMVVISIGWVLVYQYWHGSALRKATPGLVRAKAA